MLQGGEEGTAERAWEGGSSTHPLEMPSGSSGTWRSDLVVKSCGSHSRATSDDLRLVKRERLCSHASGKFSWIFHSNVKLAPA